VKIKKKKKKRSVERVDWNARKEKIRGQS